jgi:flagellar assembly factor FliW
MIIESKRIGRVEVDENRVIRFEDGLVGFPELKTFFLADDPADVTMPFKWLVSAENPELIFLVTDPGIFFKDYVFDLPEEDRRKLQVNTEDDVSVITILTVPSEAKKMIANLRAPLVINWRSLGGRQVILKNTAYTTKHYIFVQETPEQNNGTDSSKTNSGTGTFATGSFAQEASPSKKDMMAS